MPRKAESWGLTMRGFLITAILLAPFAAMAQTITPAERADAARSGYASCMRGQMAKIENAQAYIELIDKYCVCFGNKLTARMNPQDLSEFEGNKGLANERMITFAENIGKECKTELGL
jgi:hypothetical protein